MTPTDVANIALGEIGQRSRISSFEDGTPASQAAALFYTPKLQMLTRAAPWDSMRAQRVLTLLRAAQINGVVSNDPPPQSFGFEYAYPADCLKARFIIPTLALQSQGVPLTTAPGVNFTSAKPPTAIPFVVATDKDASGNNIKVILTNLPQAILIYTRDLSQDPDIWDALFLSAATALLGAYFINALTGDKGKMAEQIGLAKNMIDQARAASANEGISNTDHIPDWMQVRFTSAVSWGWNTGGPGNPWTGWDQCQFPDGLFY